MQCLDLHIKSYLLVLGVLTMVSPSGSMVGQLIVMCDFLKREEVVVQKCQEKQLKLLQEELHFQVPSFYFSRIKVSHFEEWQKK